VLAVVGRAGQWVGKRPTDLYWWGGCFKLELLVFFLVEIFYNFKDLQNTKECLKYSWMFL
jgi:hypothetical protein